MLTAAIREMCFGFQIRQIKIFNLWCSDHTLKKIYIYLNRRTTFVLTSFTLVFGVKIAQSILHRGLKAAKCANLRKTVNRRKSNRGHRSLAGPGRRPVCGSGRAAPRLSGGRCGMRCANMGETDGGGGLVSKGIPTPCDTKHR